MGAICHITPVLNDILDLCRFDLTYLPPPHQNFTGCILSHYTTAVQPISIQLLQTKQKPRVTEAQHNAEKRFLLVLTQIINSLILLAVPATLHTKPLYMFESVLFKYGLLCRMLVQLQAQERTAFSLFHLKEQVKPKFGAITHSCQLIMFSLVALKRPCG